MFSRWIFRCLFCGLFFFALPGVASYKRIVSLTPALTEIIFALGAGESLVGVSSHSDYPEEAKAIPSVGDYGKPNIEKIAVLKPDIVIGSKEGVDTYSKILTKLGLNVVLIEIKTIEDYVRVVKNLSDVLELKTADSLLQTWQTQWQEIPISKNPKRILIQVDQNPLVIAGGNSFLSELLSRCGHKNVAENKRGYPVIQAEALAKLSPDLVLATVHGTTAVQNEVLSFWKNQKLIPPPSVLAVNANEASRLGPRLPLVAKDICKKIDLAKTEPLK